MLLNLSLVLSARARRGLVSWQLCVPCLGCGFPHKAPTWGCSLSRGVRTTTSLADVI